jgi:hypothetical protein
LMQHIMVGPKLISIQLTMKKLLYQQHFLESHLHGLWGISISPGVLLNGI